MAEYCKSIIADGKELITGNESGPLVVQELHDEKVYITFKEDLTSLTNAFYGCSALTTIPENLFANCPEATSFTYAFYGCSALTTIPENLFANCPKVTDFPCTFWGCGALTTIPENLFANCPKVTDFSYAFAGCGALTTIPENLFANCPKVTDFSYAFYNCTAVTGESPYTMIGDKKVHLYERKNYPEHFTEPTSSVGCFHGCRGLSDYNNIPSSWK